MLSPQQKSIQQQIIADLGVKAIQDVQAELSARVQFIKNYLLHSGARSLVIGISGGIDSLLVGCMAQQAVEQLRAAGHTATFIALRLPYGVQHDAADAEAALAHIQPDRSLTINIKTATDASLQALIDAGQSFTHPQQQDFIVGNIKARQRMISCYAVAAAEQGLVMGSDQAAEVLMGYFTKYGDGAADLMPLAGLTKTQVRQLAAQCQVPPTLIHKVPTADLESLNPLLPDEQSFGLSYNEIDAFLLGETVSADAFDIIVRHYHQGEHKRLLPASPLNTPF